MEIKNFIHTINTYDVLIISSFIWFFGKFIRYVFPPLFELLQETYMVSTTALGWTFSIFLFAYALVQFPSGILSDKIGSFWVITVGILLSSIGSLVLIFDLMFEAFVLMVAALGIGTGVHKTSAVQLLANVYPANKGRTLGIFDTFGTFGGVVAPAAVIIVAMVPGPIPGWRLLFFSVGILGLIFTFTFIKRAPKKAQKESFISNIDAEMNNRYIPNLNSIKSSFVEYFNVFKKREFIIFVTAAILFSFTYYGTVSFLPLYLTQEASISSAYASLFYSVLFIASISQVAAGELSDRYGTLSVMSGALGFSTLSFIFFMASTNGGPLFIGISVLCIGLGVHSFRPVRGAFLMEFLPDNISAGSLGIVRTLLMGSGAISPGIIGTLSELVSFRFSFWLLTISIGIATLFSLLLIICTD